MIIDKIKFSGDMGYSLCRRRVIVAMEELINNSRLFYEEYSSDVLGVGPACVDSIKYYLLAAGLIDEKLIGRNKHHFLSEVGEIIYKCDRYFRDYFTLGLMHYHMVNSSYISAIWPFFFKFYNGNRFTTFNLLENMKLFLDENYDGLMPSDRTIENAIGALLRNYLVKLDYPSESSIPMLSKLGLIHYYRKSGQTPKYIKGCAPSNIHPLLILYICVDLCERDGVYEKSLDTLSRGNESISSIFNLYPCDVVHYLDDLTHMGYLRVSYKEGVAIVKINPISKKEVLLKYYEENPEMSYY